TTEPACSRPAPAARRFRRGRHPGRPPAHPLDIDGNICTIWYMITDDSIEVAAPPATVWDVFADVERWPTWTGSVTRLTPLDGPDIEVGRRFEVVQPRFPRL